MVADTNSDIDAVFIGAGINSLGAALLLAQTGWRVLVIDRNEEPGGAVRTQALTLPGFQHDIGAMNLSLFTGSPFYQQHKDALARKGVDFITADCSAGSVFLGGRFLGISMDQEETHGTIARFSRSDAEAWRTWRADFDDIAPTMFQIFGSPAPFGDPREYAFENLSDVPDSVQNRLRSILLDSLRTNLTARFESEELRAMIAAWGLHPDYAPDIAGGCFYPFLETNLDARQGISLVRGGSGRVIEALVALIKEAGGDVRTDTDVDKIVIEKDRAIGVRLKDGKIIHAKRAIIASTTLRALLDLTDHQLPLAEEQRAQLALWYWNPDDPPGPVRLARLAGRGSTAQLLRSHRSVDGLPGSCLSGEPGGAAERGALLCGCSADPLRSLAGAGRKTCLLDHGSVCPFLHTGRRRWRYRRQVLGP